MSIFLFFLPGIFLIFSGSFNKKGPVELLTYAAGISMSFFIVISWLLGPFHISLLGSVYLVLIFSIILLAAEHKKIRLPAFRLDATELSLLGLMLVVILLRLVPMVLQIVPAGAGMSSQAYIARMIVENDGMSGQLPSAQAGLPALSAMISLIGGMPVYRSILLISCLAFGFLTSGLYVLLLRFYDKKTAFFSSAAISFLLLSPQDLIGSGGGPSMLAAFFLVLSISLLPGIKDGLSKEKLLAAALFFVTSLLVDPFVLYPLDLTFILWTIPLALLIGPGISRIILLRKKRLKVILAVLGLIIYSIYYVHISSAMCPVTKADLEAFSWIDKTMGKTSVFLNNAGDAGIWIPAITGRKLWVAHGMPDASYIYIGSKQVGDVKYKAEVLRDRHSRYRLVFIKDGAQVWKIL